MSRGVVISRDSDAGFPIGSMPSVSEDQFNWLSFRMGLSSDALACQICEVDPAVLDEWLESDDFRYAYDQCLENKREAFKYLITQLDGKALRVINELLDSGSVQGKVHAVQLLLRAQGLLMDKQQTVDLNSVAQLITSLRETSAVTAIPARVGHRRARR